MSAHRSAPPDELAVARLAHFLHRFGTAEGGRTRPPAEFGTVSLDAVYRQFYPRLGGGADFRTFKQRLIVRREAVGAARTAWAGWDAIPRAELWAALVPYRAAGAEWDGLDATDVDSAGN